MAGASSASATPTKTSNLLSTVGNARMFIMLFMQDCSSALSALVAETEGGGITNSKSGDSSLR